MYKIIELREIQEREDFTDPRFINMNKLLGEALEKVKSYEPRYIFEFQDEKAKTFLTSYAKENTWLGQKTLFLSSIKVENSSSEKKTQELLAEIFDFYTKRAKEDGYDAIMFESSNKKYNALYEKKGFKSTRKLINFSAKREEVLKNLEKRIDKSKFVDYKIEKLQLDDIYKYVSFQDTRPGWNTSNLSIISNQFNSLLSFQDKLGEVYAICIYDERFGLISRLAVMPLARSNMLGSYIMLKAIERIKSEDIFFSDIIDEEGSSIKFLENMGFVQSEIKMELCKEINENYKLISEDL